MAAGPIYVKVYEISLSVPDPTGASNTMLVRADWTVTEFLYPPPQIDVLIGLDLANGSTACQTFANAPMRSATSPARCHGIQCSAPAITSSRDPATVACSRSAWIGGKCWSAPAHSASVGQR